MTKSSKLVFFGNERLVSGLPSTDAPVLRGLIAAGYEIVAIVSHHTQARSRKARPLEVASLAEEYSIPLLLPDKPGDIKEELRALHADAAVLVAYGRIIPQRIINVFAPIGVVNLHPSLLPRHRGPTPIETTLLCGDDVAGVSVMQLTAGMDEGPVYAQRSIPLTGHETKQELYTQLSGLGAHLLLDILPGILTGQITPTPQSDNGVTYTSMLTRHDGTLDPLTDTASVINRKVRAYQYFPKARLTINNNEVIVTSSIPTHHVDDQRLVIACAENTHLEILELIAPSGKKMSGAAYLRGYARP